MGVHEGAVRSCDICYRPALGNHLFSSEDLKEAVRVVRMPSMAYGRKNAVSHQLRQTWQIFPCRLIDALICRKLEVNSSRFTVKFHFVTFKL
jgi:hypothetical protein